MAESSVIIRYLELEKNDFKNETLFRLEKGKLDRTGSCL